MQHKEPYIDLYESQMLAIKEIRADIEKIKRSATDDRFTERYKEICFTTVEEMELLLSDYQKKASSYLNSVYSCKKESQPEHIKDVLARTIRL